MKAICFSLLLAATTVVVAAESPPARIAASHVPEQPHSGEPVVISATLPAGTARVTLEYQLVDPGKYIDLKDPAYKNNWVALAMSAGPGGAYSAELPGRLQVHRRLVRYRVKGMDDKGQPIMIPAAEDPEPNFAYFVYDGIPGWSGAIEPRSNDPRRSKAVQFPPSVMRSVQAYHLISKASSVENATWREQAGGKDYKYTGTIVSDGKVYDHVRFRARGVVWRYAMGKNMWKFDFNKGHPLAARDDHGQFYRVPWSKVNLRACIQQGDYGHRGEQGMFESVGFRLFALAGVAAPRTHWVQLRIIDEAEESPANQYHGDFWGLYLAIENEDGNFLKEHGLPSGNLYKMEGGWGTLSSHGAGAVTNSSDLERFMGTYNTGNPSVDWWRSHLDLPAYFSYRSIIECIHHYDVGDGKNYDYFLNPNTGRWTVIPWDIDLTWSDNMYGHGGEPFKSRVLSRPVFRVDYQNRLREIRDLIFNPEQTGRIIDDCAAIIADPAGGLSMVDADRAKWDYHPAMAGGGKAGQGLFYEAVPSHDFRGMVRLMKLYVRTRGAWVDANLLGDVKAPAAPSVTYTGPTNFPASHLAFHCSDFSGPTNFAAMKWRLAEIPDMRNRQGHNEADPFEINPVWESDEATTFNPDLALPSTAARPNRIYRVRARLKDAAGRWSHWSAPVEFKAGG